MTKKSVLALILITWALPSLVLGNLAVQADGQYPHLSNQESQVVSLVNGTRAYDYDLELENIALNHSLSDYAFRSSGSPNANRTADWIKSQFESAGLEASLESFQFTTWKLSGQPMLVLDEDGDPNTANDKIATESFQCQHFSWPTPVNGTFTDLSILPLPDGITYSNFRLGSMPRGTTLTWTNFDITDKIVLVGREANWFRVWRDWLLLKIETQRPAALVFTWWYDWMNFTPPFFGSAAGMSFWNLSLPVGWVDYRDGMLIREKALNTDLHATIKIPAVIENGTHSNVIGRLRGRTNPDKCLIVSGHYDTVMDAGFCDNGAGTAGVIELARVFTEAARTGTYVPDQSLVFIAFTGEELGFVGSIDYVKRHKADMKNIDAVINLDCIGHDLLTVSETLADEKGISLDQIVIRAAQDLGVAVETEPDEVGGSDQETFRNPVQTGIFQRDLWGIDPAINETVRVKSSTVLGSSPLFYSDKLAGGTPGWAHTEYDNSTSTLTLGWVKAADLEGHIKTAALSVMRVLATPHNSLTLQLSIGAAVAVAVIIVLAILERSRVKKAAKIVRDEIMWYINMKEVVVILILLVFMLFLSYASTSTVVRTEIIMREIPTIIPIRYFGFPFQMIAIPQQVRSLTTQMQETIVWNWASNHAWVWDARALNAGTPQVLWMGLALNTLIFALLSLAIVYFGAKLWDMLSSTKSTKA